MRHNNSRQTACRLHSRRAGSVGTITAFTLSVAVAAATGVAGCSSKSDPTGETVTTSSCAITFSGNTPGASNVTANCGALALAPDAGAPSPYMLKIHVPTKQVALLQVDIPLGATPSPGRYSSETVHSWGAIAVVATATTQCTFAAGADAVPAGSFTLNVTSVDGGDGGQPVVHGSLNVTMVLHAPPATDCGAGDTEDVALVF